MFGRKRLHCSFCGRDETQVAKLVAGPKVYICDACVTIARKIMDSSDGGSGDSRPRVSAFWWRRLVTRISRLVSRGNVQRQSHAGVI